eukprot:56069-Eustigmatos_ZCMA.PRE.2
MSKRFGDSTLVHEPRTPLLDTQPQRRTQAHTVRVHTQRHRPPCPSPQWHRHKQKDTHARRLLSHTKKNHTVRTHRTHKRGRGQHITHTRGVAGRTQR